MAAEGVMVSGAAAPSRQLSRRSPQQSASGTQAGDAVAQRPASANARRTESAAATPANAQLRSSSQRVPSLPKLPAGQQPGASPRQEAAASARSARSADNLPEAKEREVEAQPEATVPADDSLAGAPQSHVADKRGEPPSPSGGLVAEADTKLDSAPSDAKLSKHTTDLVQQVEQARAR